VSVRAGEPLGTRLAVPVAGGELDVYRTDTAPQDADVVVLAIHGVSSTHMIWRPTVRALCDRDGASVLAPDLRGRGRSVGLPGPYGFAAHVADLLATLDAAGVERAVLAGHSLGAYLATSLAAAHPERVSGVVMIDGGLAVPSAFEEDADELVEAMLDTALEYARTTYASAGAYVDSWREHPAFVGEWNGDADAYVRYEVSGPPGELQRALSVPAVRADLDDLVRDEVARAAVDRVRVPISLLTAPRGLRNDYALLPTMLVRTFAATHPRAHVEQVPDVNHYTVLLGERGSARVAAAIAAAAGTTPPSPRA
jgi:pimeloyl-ACP methyl ester carboxylesterase